MVCGFRSTWALVVGSATLTFVGGCTGLIGDTGTGAQTSAETTCTSLATVDAQRLTKFEYNNVIRDLFGLTGDFSASFTDPAAGTAGFTTETTAQNLSPDVVRDFYNGATAVVAALFATNPNPVLTCAGGDDCAKQIINDLASRAFRRPVTSDEAARLFTLYASASGAAFADAMKLVVTGVLLSPQFIFRTYDVPASSDAQVPLEPYELASRLSFFLWGSIPDAELLSAAADGSLMAPATLEAQTRRMLSDPKASYLALFARQWLGLDGLDGQTRSSPRYPLWSDATQASMKGETYAFMANMVEADASVMDFVTAKYTFVDANVAQIYKMRGTFDGFTRVELDATRVGVLTQPAILALTSSGDVTSPVRRGKWVLGKLLCSAPPPPPPNVPGPPADAGGVDLTDESQIKARLALHRTQGASCNGCHSAMDPIGLSFENFDAMGYYRTSYPNGDAIDASGQLPTGEQLDSVTDLAAVLANDERFPACFVAQLNSFAQGRDATTEVDSCDAQAIATASVGADKKFSDVVVQIVSNRNFTTRTVQ